MKFFNKFTISSKGLLFLIFLLGMIGRGYLLWQHAGNGIQDADEAVVGLMAKHIVDGINFPLLWYGQHYMGTLPSFISALFFLCFGLSATAVRVVPIIFSILFIYFVYKLASEMFGESVGLLSGLWIAVCPSFLAIFSLKQAGYMIVLVLGTWILLLTYQLCRSTDNPRRIKKLLLLLGVLSGLGFWIHLQIVPYILAAFCFCLLKARKVFVPKNLLLVGLCFFVGSSPLIIYNLGHHGRNIGFLLEIFTNGEHHSWVFASRLYNSIVCNLPILLGSVPLWACHWIGFSWYLPPILNESISLTLLVAASVIVVIFCGHRAHSARTFFSSLSSKTRRYLLMLAAIIVLILICEIFLFFTYLYELQELVSVEPIIWNQFQGAPLLTPAFLLTELFSPSMWVYFLYLPGICYAIYIAATRRGEIQLQLLLVTLIFIFGSSIGTHYGDMRSPRYLMPLYSIIPIIFAWFVGQVGQRMKWLAGVFPLVVFLLHTVSGLSIPPNLYLQPVHYVNWWNQEQSHLIPSSNTAVIEFLHSQKISSVYAKYWLAIPLIFDSEEQIVASPGFPGRYPLYDKRVEQAETVAYLFHVQAHENAAFELLLKNAGMGYAKQRISSYDIYYNVNLGNRFSSPLWPQIVKLFQFP